MANLHRRLTELELTSLDAKRARVAQSEIGAFCQEMNVTPEGLRLGMEGILRNFEPDSPKAQFTRDLIAEIEQEIANGRAA